MSDEARNDPIALKEVQIPPEMLACLEACWAASGPGCALRHALYRCPEDWVKLVREVLRLDIRSLHQRTSTRQKQPNASHSGLRNTSATTEVKEEHQRSVESICGLGMLGNGQSAISESARAHDHANTREQSPSAAEQPNNLSCESPTGKYSVTLQGVTVLYDILADNTVLVCGASVG